MVDAWKDVVRDALIVRFIYIHQHEYDPERALADLMAWETKVALDPAVSSAARALIERGRTESRDDDVLRDARLWRFWKSRILMLPEHNFPRHSEFEYMRNAMLNPGEL